MAILGTSPLGGVPPAEILKAGPQVWRTEESCSRCQAPASSKDPGAPRWSDFMGHEAGISLPLPHCRESRLWTGLQWSGLEFQSCENVLSLAYLGLPVASGRVLHAAGYKRGYTLDLGLLFWVVRAGPALGRRQRGTWGHSFKVRRLSLSGSDPALPWPWMWGPRWTIHSYFTLFLTWVRGCELNFTSLMGLLFPDGAFYWNHQKSLLKCGAQVPNRVWLSATS